jgi:osmotically-inducible protein OsmY
VEQIAMTTTVQTDVEIQQAVLQELGWDPEVDSTDIGVEVDDGVVTLTGNVESYWMKLAAERAALRVDGVRAVANDIDVKAPGLRIDTEIAKNIVDAFQANMLVPEDRINVTVRDGWVTLEGIVDRKFIRDQAETIAHQVTGVVGVTNLLTVKPRQENLLAKDIKTGIEHALIRSAQVDASRINVSVDMGRVTLSGTVRSWAEKYEAEQAAWRSPGVTEVINKIEVRPIKAEYA